MANQEFLASFGVEIDESGVSRLQAVLEENRALPTVLMPHLVYLVTIFFHYRSGTFSTGWGYSREPSS